MFQVIEELTSNLKKEAGNPVLKLIFGNYDPTEAVKI
jgi:hypothetical protein